MLIWSYILIPLKACGHVAERWMSKTNVRMQGLLHSNVFENFFPVKISVNALIGAHVLFFAKTRMHLIFHLIFTSAFPHLTNNSNWFRIHLFDLTLKHDIYWISDIRRGWQRAHRMPFVVLHSPNVVTKVKPPCQTPADVRIHQTYFEPRGLHLVYSITHTHTGNLSVVQSVVQVHIVNPKHFDPPVWTVIYRWTVNASIELLFQSL